MAKEDALSQAQLDLNEVRSKVSDYVTQAENLLANEVGDLKMGMNSVIKKVGDITKELRDSFVSYDESVRKVSKDASAEGKRNMESVKGDLMIKLRELSDDVSGGTEKLT